ncbi:MAG: hypothetical protein AAFO07_13930 [Bacteroidota bacterium]
MKKLINFIALTFLCTSIVVAQNEAFVTKMEANIANLKNAKTVAELTEVMNVFDRIAEVESSNWLPLYYGAQTRMLIAGIHNNNGETAKVKSFVGQAQTKLDQALKINSDEAELHALQAHIYQGRIWEDYENNGPTYTNLVMASCGKATGLDPDNPRADCVMAQQIFHMPAFIGGGAENALPIFKKAKEKYKNFTPKSSIHPNWGEEIVDYYLKQAGGKKQ